MKVQKAHVLRQSFRAEPIVQVELDGPVTQVKVNFEMRNGIYRAQQDDVIQFFAYQGPGRGFGGHPFDIVMKDGTPKTLIGPWSSRAGVVNALYPDRAPAVDVVERNLSVYMHVDLRKLENLGLSFVKNTHNDEAVYIPQLT